jgi:hypothetical protein
MQVSAVLLYNRSAWRALLAATAFFSHLRGGERQVLGIRLSPAGGCNTCPRLTLCAVTRRLFPVNDFVLW